MTSHQKLEDDAAISKGDEPILVKEKDKKAPCNWWILVAIFELIIVIFLVLGITGAFDSLTDTDNESGAAGEESTMALNGMKNDDLKQSITDDDGDSYITGDTAPNMIFLVADDIGWNDISHNDGGFGTPTIDGILEGGIEFTRFYSHALCTPSRMALLTGRIAWKMGSQYPEVIHGMMAAHIPFDEKTFAEVIHEFGYYNYYVGRWGVGYASWDMTPLGRGWDKFMGYFGPEGGYYNHSTDHFDDWYGVYDFWDMNESYIDANMTYSEDLFLDRTLLYLEEARESGNPFTLTYASQTAHAPIDDDWPTFYPPTIWTECFEDDPNLIGREYYCNKVKYLDYTWGIIIDYLMTNGMWDNTIIFMTSDNGAEPFTDSGPWSDWGSNWPLRSGKVTNFEGGIKVWAGMSGGLIPEELRGTTFDELTHIVDFAATAMRLAMTNSEYESRQTLTGTEKVVDGNNLYNLEHHDLILHNVLPHYVPSWVKEEDSNYAATDGEWKYYVGFEETSALQAGWYNAPGKGMVTLDNDPVAFKEGGGYCTTGCLFHLSTDPNEEVDVSQDYVEVTDYFIDVIDAVYQGGFDEEYHSGQPYEEDYRGFQADGILRPYLSSTAVEDYANRTGSTSYNFTYDYATYSLSWEGDYDGFNNPFDSDPEE